jgi:hypothetical protein
VTIVTVEKQCVANYERVFIPLFIQHEKCMRHVILSFVACPTVPCFPRYLSNGTISEKKVIGQKICVLIFSTRFI